jgi:NADPH:quinone reductase-like Zn-dependent oxidoreductase
LIKVNASALNHRELWIQKGLYPGMQLPCILGADGAGEVVEVSDDKDKHWIGKSVIIYPANEWGDNPKAPNRTYKVLGMPVDGTIAEYICVSARLIVEKPSYLSDTEAAALPIATLTSWRALVTHGGITAGQKILITGIGGGVAQAGLQIALAHQAEVYVTSSSQAKIEDAKAKGAKGGVNYREDDWHQQLKALSGGIDIVLDSSPSPILDEYFRFMQYGGRIVTYGSTGSPKTSISISKFFLRQIQFIGTTMGSLPEFKAAIAFMDKHNIVPQVSQVFNMDESLDAIEALRSGNQIGKVVIRH